MKVNFDLSPVIESIVDSIPGDIDTSIVYSLVAQMFPKHAIVYEDFEKLLSKVLNSSNFKGKYTQYINGNWCKINLGTTKGVSVNEESSFVGDYCYFASKEILFIELSNKLYMYENVSIDTYTDFVDASSKGKFYNREIKGQYKSQEIH